MGRPWEKKTWNQKWSFSSPLILEKNNILEKQFKRSTKLFVLERALLSDTTGTITTTNY